MIALVLILSCHKTISSDSGTSTPTTYSVDTAQIESTDTATITDVCNLQPKMSSILASSVQRMEIRGDQNAELGTDVACTSQEVGSFQNAVAAGGWETADKGGGFGWVAVVPGDRTGTFSVEQADLVLRGSDINDNLGTQVVFPGDVDGDGVGDFLVTGFSAFRPNHTSGAAFLFEVRPGWFVPEDAVAHFIGGEPGARLGGAAWVGDVDDDSINEILLGHTYAGSSKQAGFIALHRGQTFTPEVQPSAASAQFPAEDVFHATGWEMEVADLDGDGIRDLAHGEFDWQGTSAPGRVTILTGPLLEGSKTLESPDIIIEGDLEADETSTGRHLEAGDLNGDGFDDLVISAHVASTAAGIRTGTVYVFFGPLSRKNYAVHEADLVVEGEDEYSWFGNGLEILDHDGDGFMDLAVASPVDPFFPTGCPARVYVFSGPLGSGRLVPSLDASIAYEDDQSGAQFGKTLSGCDLDGDGDEELVIGSPWASIDSVPLVGRVQVIDGGHRSMDGVYR